MQGPKAQLRNKPFALLKGHLKKGAQEAQTPQYLWELLEKTYGKFDLDPCPPNPKFDGLAIPWKRLNFVNPPFKEIPKWLEKAIEEKKKGHATLFLIPFRPDRKYFRDLVIPNASEIRILSQLIQFRGFDRPFPQRMCIIVFGKPKTHLKQNICETVPLYTLETEPDTTFEDLIQHYVKLRHATLVKDPDHVPMSTKQIYGLPHWNAMKWVDVLEKRKNTDLYGMIGDHANTFIKLIIEPNVSAFIYPRHLPMKKGQEVSPFPCHVVLGQPPLKASQMSDLTRLPPTFVWDISSYDKVIGPIKKS